MTTLPPSQSEALLRRHLATFVQKSFKAINPGATYLPPTGTSRPSPIAWNNATGAKSGGWPSRCRRVA
jgi:hypothetical protein